MGELLEGQLKVLMPAIIDSCGVVTEFARLPCLSRQ